MTDPNAAALQGCWRSILRDNAMRPWKVHLTCCGRDDGIYEAETWEEAHAFREAYTSGPGVNEHGYSGIGPGHRRSGVITHD